MNSKGYFSWETVVVPILVTITIASVLALYFQSITITGYGGASLDGNTISNLTDFDLNGLKNDINALTSTQPKTNSTGQTNTANNQTIIDPVLFGVTEFFTGSISVISAGLGIAWNLLLLFFKVFTMFSPFIDGILGNPVEGSPLEVLGIGLKFIIVIVEFMGLWYLTIRIKSSIWRGV